MAKRKTRKKTGKKKELVTRLWVLDSEDNIVRVEMPTKYQWDFIRKFGTEKLTYLSDYTDWMFHKLNEHEQEELLETLELA